MIRCADGSLYTGIATDVDRRVSEHAGGKRGARRLRGRGPLELVLQKWVGERGLASRVELRIKRLTRQEKETLLQSPARLDELVRDLAATPQ